ncbi:MAG: ribonuclease HI family protein [Thermorudis peleae]|nr:ribonuclease HI family protein [Thermorudis peleae]
MRSNTRARAVSAPVCLLHDVSVSKKEAAVTIEQQTPRITLVVDGGSRGNPGFGYGSFHLSDSFGHDEIMRLEFGDGVTNNQAEYRTLLAALERAQEHARQHDWPVSQVALHIITDSQLMAEQLRGRWQVRDLQLRMLYDRARKALRAFGHVTISHRPRREIVAVLGH